MSIRRLSAHSHGIRLCDVCESSPSDKRSEGALEVQSVCDLQYFLRVSRLLISSAAARRPIGFANYTDFQKYFRTSCCVLGDIKCFFILRRLLRFIQTCACGGGGPLDCAQAAQACANSEGWQWLRVAVAATCASRACQIKYLSVRGRGMGAPAKNFTNRF